jgi:predicted tellurium resistance membrane protein TerC
MFRVLRPGGHLFIADFRPRQSPSGFPSPHRLVNLSYGLSVILAFIGVKLLLHALHENTVPFINSGEHVGVPELNTGVSLAVIASVLAITSAASLLRIRQGHQRATSGPPQH